MTFKIKLTGRDASASKSAVCEDGVGGMYYSLMSRSVFERMWCIQEVAFARKVLVVCGADSIKWEQMVLGLERLEYKQHSSIGSARVARALKERVALQGKLRNIVRPANHQQSEQLLLSTLLDKTRIRVASRPHDKVYALHGLLDILGLHMLKPEYEKPVREVFAEVTTASFSVDQNLDILYQTSGFPDSFNLPSWVPDFTDTRPPAMLIHGAYNATNGSRPFWRVSDRTLILHGKIFDRIHNTGDSIMQFSPLSDHTAGLFLSVGQSKQILHIFEQWATLAQSLVSPQCRRTKTQLFAHVLKSSIPGMKPLLPAILTISSWRIVSQIC
jgi:hypothetical protein